jgi:hypothetical protein
MQKFLNFENQGVLIDQKTYNKLVGIEPVTQGDQNLLFFENRFAANDTFSKIPNPQEQGSKITYTSRQSTSRKVAEGPNEKKTRECKKQPPTR